MTAEKVRALVASLKCPTAPDANAEFRAKILDYGGNDRVWAAELKARCAADPVFWINATCCTEEPKWHKEKHIPLILYPFQASFVVAQKTYWETGDNYTILKSREQGGTIIPLYNMQHEWQFSNNADFLIGSEKKEKVEGKSFGTAMFPKLVYNLQRQPEWLLPEGFKCEKPHKIDMHLLNPVTGCLIKGETCNENFGASGRARGAHIDEAGLIDQRFPGRLEAIHGAIGMVTRSTGWVSTPRGDNYFRDLCNSPALKHHIWHWTDNPDWQEGSYICEPGCPAHAHGGKPHSVRYDDACKQYGNDPVKIARELDLDWGKSGSPLFDPDMTARVRTLLTEKKPKLFTVSLSWNKTEDKVSTADGLAYYRATRNWKVVDNIVESGCLRVRRPPRWCTDKTCICMGTGLHSIVWGADSAQGLEHRDQNIAYGIDVTAGLVFAEYCSKHDPDVFGEHLAQMARWSGKSAGFPRDAHVGCEWNFTGKTVNKILVQCGIPTHTHYSEDPNRRNHVAPKTGVVITPHNKYDLIMEHLIPAVARPYKDGLPLLIVPFIEFWLELDHIIKYVVDKGAINPDVPRTGGQKRKHDDRPMALLSGLVAAMARYYRMKGHINKLWLPQQKKVLRGDKFVSDPSTVNSRLISLTGA